MKRQVLKNLKAKKISRKNLTNIHAGNGGLKLNNGSSTTCGDEPENKMSIEYTLWLNCIKSNDPRGGTEFCAFG